MTAPTKKVPREFTTVVLGAGASRGVSYCGDSGCLSPLDADFFQILAQQNPNDEQLRRSVRAVLDECYSYPFQERLWDSMEKAFYTMHLNRVIGFEIFRQDDVLEIFLENFARCVEYLLRQAHGRRVCDNHKRLFKPMSSLDAIISFNYDLVAERALGAIHGNRVEFGAWLYGGSLCRSPRQAESVPCLYKLHGSSNWKIHGGEFSVRQRCWNDFDKKPGYLGYKAKDIETFPIQLPYWEKRIEVSPWSRVWQQAAARLRQTRNLIIWGYSLPLSDIKAREFFRIALDDLPLRVCVIDPGQEARERWRSLIHSRPFWTYSSFAEFCNRPPDWWP